ncbi:MAG: 3'-5' exonuclease [Candidatus Levyibacteriota bacterium]
MRFESPGRFSYLRSDGDEMGGTLLRKDQFMIVDQRILFMSTEGIDYPRDLVYQEYFSEQKTGFVLPEIVEQMEKAQDKIIRSNYYGSFLVSGAAGSGKTTLSLHRVAYLLQSPQTQSIFKPHEIIVFVQDASTKHYFSGLLPQLGINSVKIVSFDEWAMKILDLSDMKFVRRYGIDERDKDAYEYAKKKALTFLKHHKGKSIDSLLVNAYEKIFSNEQMRLLKRQLKDRLLDRFDLTVLMKIHYSRNNGFNQRNEKFVQQKSTRKYIKKKFIQPVQYSLIVLDEAENYLGEQIQLIKSCINPKTNAMIYVGDLVQQTMLWTIKDWSEVDEQFASERKVVLQKVYRNTKQILEYIRRVGYKIEIPPNSKKGEQVEEKIISKKPEEIRYVKKLIAKYANNSIGLLSKTEEYLEEYKKIFRSNKNIKIMTINEAQGVEFEVVLLVGMNSEFYKNETINEAINNERRKVNRDLIYVALTRAMKGLYIFGNTKIQSLIAV